MMSTRVIGRRTGAVVIAVIVAAWSRPVQAAPASHQPAPDLRARQLLSLSASGPLSFEENRGQADKRARFLCRRSGFNLFLLPGEAVLALQTAPAPAHSGHLAGGVVSQADPLHPNDSLPISERILRLRLLGASRSVNVDGEAPVSERSNYLIGVNPRLWHTDLAHYARVRYHNVYPGIDLVYYGSGQALEHDFVVAPGASAARIQVQAAGCTSVTRDANAGLSLNMPGGSVHLDRLVAYQQTNGQRLPVDARFVVRNGNRIGFRLGRYDHSKPLVIDPVLVYSTYFGGAGGETASGIALDAQGNAYIAGYTSSLNLPVLSAIRARFAGGASDAFIAKFSPSGDLLYSTYLGGKGNDYGRSVAVDQVGNIYVTGDTTSSDFPTWSPLQGSLKGSSDVFVTKLDPTGNQFVYSTYLGGSGADFGYGIGVDNSGDAYVAGYTQSSDFPVVTPYQAQNNGASNAFVTKIDPVGSSIVYSTYIGGSGSDGAAAIAVDPFGDAFITGVSSSSDFPVVTGGVAANKPNPGSMADSFVSKLDPAGTSLVYSSYIGGAGNSTVAKALAIDSAGDAFITGYTYTTSLPLVSPIQGTLAGDADAFVIEIDSAGANLLFSTYLGGKLYDFGDGIAVDSSGSVYVDGYTDSTDFPVTNLPTQPANHGLYDAFVVKIIFGTAVGPSGVTLAAYLANGTYLGGSSTDVATCIAVDATGAAYVAGYTSSFNFPTTAGAVSISNRGSSDAFVARTTFLPPAPASLVATTPVPGAIALSWVNNAGPAAVFAIDRQLGGGPFIPLTTTQPGMIRFTDIALASSTRYGYRIRTLLGGLSSDYVVTSAVTLPLPPPAPSGLTATALSQTSVRLTWVRHSTNETGFKILRGIGNSQPFVVAAVGAGITTYTDVSAAANTTYTYKVVATNGGGDSAPSAPASVTTPPAPPTAPSNLKAASVSNSLIQLTWTTTSTNETGFKIMRRSGASAFVQIAMAPKGAVGFPDNSVAAATSYTYEVVATNGGGDSPASNQASAVSRPNAPTNLSAVAISSQRVDLSWTNPGGTLSAIKIYRRIGTGSLQLLVTVGSQSKSYSDRTVVAQTTYVYVVVASDAGGDSAQSVGASVTTP